VFLRPATQGNGLIAGGGAGRAQRSASRRLTKTLGSNNLHNVLKAT
jgi:ribosomal protein S5